MKILHFHCNWHLGDNILNITFLNKLSNYICQNNILIKYYLLKEYISEVEAFVTPNNIILYDLEMKPKESIHLWFVDSRYKNNIRNYKFPVCYDKFLMHWFNEVLQLVKIPMTIDDIRYTDNDLYMRYDALNKKYKNIDILYVNSVPRSGQIKYITSDWDQYGMLLNKSFNIVSTTKINNDIKCTMDDNLLIKDIAAISIKAKIIIAVNSGVTTGLLNTITINNAKIVYIFDNGLYYSYENFVNKKTLSEITVDELKMYLS